MIKVALASLAMCLLTSCGMAENTKNQEPIMQDEIALHDALIQAGSTQLVTGYKNDDVLETIKAAIRLVSRQSDMVSELPNLGVYNPFTPKTKKGWRFYFNTEKVTTTIIVHPSNVDIVDSIYIFVGENSKDIKSAKMPLNLGGIKLNYLNYQVTGALNNPSLHNAKFIYELEDDPNVHIDLNVKDTSINEINSLVESKLLPTAFSGMNVYPARTDKG